LYVFYFDKKLLRRLFISAKKLDNDPRLNNVNIPYTMQMGKASDFAFPGTRTKHKRNVTNLMKKKVASNQQWRCGSCNTMLDET